MINKQVKLLVGVFVFSILFLAVASAATTTLFYPVSNTNHTGTIANFSCHTDDIIAVNATIWYNTSTAADAVAITLYNNSNDGNFTFNTTSALSVATYTDAATYYFWCAVENSTAQSVAINSSAISGITIDNTAPAISVTKQRNLVSRGMTQQVTWSIADALGGFDTTDVCTLTKVNGDTVAKTSSPATFTFGDLNQVGSYTFNCTGTDYTGNLNYASTTFQVETDEIDGVDDIIGKGRPSPFLIIMGIVMALIVIILIIVLSSKKSKK